jgi:signal transduction histidine kinase/ActR/RegA family two-component response regulator
MSPPSSQSSSDLIEVLASRRAQARLRIGLAVVLCVGFGGMVGWPFALGWLATYAALQAFEYFVLGRRRLPTAAAVALLAANSIVFGAYAAMGPLRDGVWGLACGVSLLCGALLNAALTSQKSKIAFLATMSPFVVYLIGMPFAALALGAQAYQALALAASGGLIVGSAWTIWRQAARALIAESEARARAEAADTAKSAFVAMVSHELRTPISAIMAGATEAGRTGSADARRSNLDLISSSARMMRALLDDLLDLSKIEAGKMGAEAVDFDLRRLTLETVRFWAPEARRKALAFRLEGAKRLPAWIRSDPTRLRQILNNLLSNALKFTEAGSITLSVAVRGERLALTVSDTGPGMSPEQLGRLFTAYDQAGDSVARTHGGTGLGLQISRELARLMGGDLTVTSAPGQGAAFTIDLPLRRADPVAALAETSEASQGLRVLIADDHEVNRRAFSLILEPVCATVTVAEDGRQALDLLAQEPFDLVLMDLNMPRLNGMQATRTLRALPGPNQAVPVIALSASVSPAEQQACLAAGMSAFVMKPVEAQELFRAIGAVLAEAPAEPADAVA